MTAERMDFCDGKYTVINDNGKLTALRYGQPWDRDLVGDNLVYWMFVEARKLKAQSDEVSDTLIVGARRLKEQRDELQATLEQLLAVHIQAIKDWSVEGGNGALSDADVIGDSDAVRRASDLVAKATGGQ